MAVDVDRSADDRRVSAEFAPPVIVRQRDDGIGAGLLAFLASEEPAQLRLDAEHGKIGAIDRLDPLAFRLLSGDAQMNRIYRDGQHIREDVQTFTIVAKVEPGMAVRHLPDGALLKYQNELVRIL